MVILVRKAANFKSFIPLKILNTLDSQGGSPFDEFQSREGHFFFVDVFFFNLPLKRMKFGLFVKPHVSNKKLI